jgi:hypothetical protein
MMDDALAAGAGEQEVADALGEVADAAEAVAAEGGGSAPPLAEGGASWRSALRGWFGMA